MNKKRFLDVRLMGANIEMFFVMTKCLIKNIPNNKCLYV